MVVSLVPLDVGKPSLKSDKAEVVNGECQWLKPVFETARLVQDSKSMKFNEKFYQFLVSSPVRRDSHCVFQALIFKFIIDLIQIFIQGSTKAGLLGETSINLADYAQVFKPYSVSLPLKGSNSGAILHVSIFLHFFSFSFSYFLFFLVCYKFEYLEITSFPSLL